MAAVSNFSLGSRFMVKPIKYACCVFGAGEDMMQSVKCELIWIKNLPFLSGKRILVMSQQIKQL